MYPGKELFILTPLFFLYTLSCLKKWSSTNVLKRRLPDTVSAVRRSFVTKLDHYLWVPVCDLVESFWVRCEGRALLWCRDLENDQGTETEVVGVC